LILVTERWPEEKEIEMGLFSSKSEQEKWDDQIAANKRAGWREAQQIATKMQKCRSNPRNGGDGKGPCPYYVDDEGGPRGKKSWW
jgi:hypothetical protein